MFKKKSDTHLCDNEINIERLDIYAIERTSYGQTLFSYRDESGNDCEFSMITTIEQHNTYVARFRVKMALEKLTYLEIKNADHADKI